MSNGTINGGRIRIFFFVVVSVLTLGYSKDLQDLSECLQCMDRGQMHNILHQIFRRYLSDGDTFNLCALAREIKADYSEGRFIEKRDSMVEKRTDKRTWVRLQNAKELKDSIFENRNDLVAMFFEMNKPTTGELLLDIAPGRVYEKWAASLVGAILRSAGAISASQWRGDLGKTTRSWKLKNEGDTLKICIQRLTQNINKDIWGKDEHESESFI